MNTSWKTTLSGVLLALSPLITLIAECINGSCDFNQIVMAFVTLLGALGIGLFARDNDVSSERAGAK